MRITITMIIEVLTRRVLTLEIVDGPTNLIQWNRFYVSRDYQKPIQPSPDQAPVIRDPAMPMINLSASLLSWSPFRKELDRWSTKLDLFSETSSTKNMSEYSKLLKLQKTQDSNMSKASNDNSMMTSGEFHLYLGMVLPKIRLRQCYQYLKWGTSSRWSSYLYRSMRNSDEMTVGKTQPTLYYRN